MSALSQPRDGSRDFLRIYTDFQRDPAMAVESSMKRELALLVSPIGLHLDWKSLAEPRDGDASAALVVITFNGKCNVEGLEPHLVDPGALAWTHISDGVILPFIDVDCDRLREFLQHQLLHMDSKLREQLFGRAIARVVGHEMYHVLAETRHHGADGVAQPACSVGELLSDDFGFAEKQFRTLRSSKLKSILTFGKPPGNKATPLSGKALYAASGCAACHGPAGKGTPRAPAIGLPAKSLNPKALLTHFDKKSEDMYRRARSLKLDWFFPTDEEIRDIVAVLSSGIE